MIPMVMSIIAKTETFQRDMARTRATVGKFDKSMSKTNATVRRLGRSMLAMAGVGGGLYLISNMLRSSGREAIGFEYNLARVATMLGKNIDYLPKLRNEIDRLSVTYGKSTTDLTSGLYDILSAQIPVAKAIKMLETNVRSATGGFTDSSVAVKASLDILGAYNLETEKAVYIQNLLHKIVEKGRLSFEDIAGKIGEVTAPAAKLDVELEALSATITTLTRAGVPLDMVFTSIRNIFAQFMDPSEQAIKVAKELDFVLDNTTIKGRGLVTIFEKMTKANARQLNILMPSIRGFTGFAAALQKAKDVGFDYAFMLSDVQVAEKNLAIANATTQVQINKTREEWNKAKRDLGDEIIPTLTESLKGLSAVLSGDIARAFDEIAKARRELDGLERRRGPAGPGAFGGFGAGTMGVPPKPRLQLGRLEISPSGYDHIQKMNNYLYEQAQKQKAFQDAINMSGQWLDEMPAAARSTGAEEVKISEKAAAERVQITSRMYQDMGRFGDGYLQAQVALLDQQKAEYGQHVTDKVLLEEWYASELKNIQEDIRLSNLNAMELYHEELRKDIEETARYSSEKFAEAARNIEGYMSDAFYSMREKGADWRDAMNIFFNNVGDAFARMAADMLARWAMLQVMNIGSAGIGGIGAFSMHTGGFVGAGGVQRMVPAGTFIGAPRMHAGGITGIRNDEVPIIAQRGERILAKGESESGDGNIIYIDTYIEKVEANDAASFDAQLYRSRETLGDIQIMNVRGNHPVGKIKR